MFYHFPIIKTIDDVLPAIKDALEFRVFEKEDYIVINYMVSGNETFPTVNTTPTAYPDDLKQGYVYPAIRRECRGIIFDRNGKLIRRGYHKFFNLGERLETLEKNIDFSQPHLVLEKLDGSMVTPLPLSQGIRWATKAGITDISMQAEAFVAANPAYQDMASSLLVADCLPIFEWCSYQNRIVINHKEDSLILTAVRNQTTGCYSPYEVIVKFAMLFDIPVVKESYEPFETIHSAQDMEGVVLTFHNGHKLKVKTEWYCQIHKAKENLLHEKGVIEVILDERTDDILAFLPDDEKTKLSKFRDDILENLKQEAWLIREVLVRVRNDNWSRKDFALKLAPKLAPYWASIIFAAWDEGDDKIWETLINTIRKNLGSQTHVNRIRHLWGGLEWNGVTQNDE